MLLTKLGVAYFGQKNWDRARDVLKSAVVLDRSNYRGLVYLGLTYEELGQLDSARASYTQARLRARGDRQKRELDNRLMLLTHKEIQVAARAALAQESTLSQIAPEANTIAVFPFRYLGTNEDLRPLERGIAQLIVADLGKVSILKLLEREQVQALVDEMQLASSGRVDPATGARSGRLLRAQNVVQGTIQEPSATTIQLDANAINSLTAGVSASGSAGGPMERLLDDQKQLVFQLLDRLGIQLTPASRLSSCTAAASPRRTRATSAPPPASSTRPRSATRVSVMPGPTPPPPSRCRARPAPRPSSWAAPPPATRAAVRPARCGSSRTRSIRRPAAWVTRAATAGSSPASGRGSPSRRARTT